MYGLIALISLVLDITVQVLRVETSSDEQRLIETSGDQTRGLWLHICKVRPGETSGNQGKLKGEQRRPGETRGHQGRLKETIGNQGRLDVTRGDQMRLDETRGDQRKLEETRGDERRLKETRGDLGRPVETRPEQSILAHLRGKIMFTVRLRAEASYLMFNCLLFLSLPLFYQRLHEYL